MPESRQACAELGAAVPALRKLTQVDQNRDGRVVVLRTLGGDLCFDLFPQFWLVAAQLLQVRFTKRRLFALTLRGLCGSFLRLRFSPLLRNPIRAAHQIRRGPRGLGRGVHDIV